MDKTAVLRASRRFADEVVKALAPDQILLFGSYATGTAREDSDINIAVLFDGFEGDWLRVNAQLNRFAWNANTLISPILLDSRVDRSGLVQEVLNTGELIYKK